MTSNRNRAEVRRARALQAERGIAYVHALRLVREEAATAAPDTPPLIAEDDEAGEEDP